MSGHRTTSTFFLLFLLLAALPATADNWPQFRGPNRDAISQEKGLLRAFPEGGPKVLWSTPVEQGYSGAAVYDGRVYFHDYDSKTSEWLVRAVALADGKELWTFRAERRIRPNHGITRTVPATDGKHVFSLDPKATFHALDAMTGKEVWSKNLVQEYGTQIPPWYAGQCPLIEADRVVVAPGGPSALVVAFKKDTGEEIWRTANPEGWLMSHASLMPAKLGGVDQYLYNALQGTMGIDRATGKLLWHHPFKFNVAVSPSPLAIDGERVFVTNGYDSGGAMFRVAKSNGSFTTESIFVQGPDEWNSEIHTPIFYQDHLFAVDKKKRGQLTCLTKDGKVVWSSTPASFDLGSYILADGMLLILDGSTGLLRFVEASAEGYKEIAKAQVLGGHDVWAPMALSSGKLVMRDLVRMVAIEVGK